MKNNVTSARFTLVNAHSRFIHGIGFLASLTPRILGLPTAHKHRTLAGWRYICAIIFAWCLLPTANAQTPMSNATKVAAGSFGTCILTNVGGVKCEGFGGSGEIGNNAFLTLKTPVDVIGLTTGVSNIAAGNQFACALTALGGIKCWGANFNGTLGDGSQSSRPVPADVLTLTFGVTAIGAGQRHACALTSSGGVKCWGGNFPGQLGDNTTSTRLAPVDVLSGPSLPALVGITAIATGNNHTCALTSSGGVKCWGSNSSGQLGDNSSTDRMTPVDVSTLTSGITALAAGGSHTCALTSAGGVTIAFTQFNPPTQ